MGIIVLSCLRTIAKKDECCFIKFDIKEFYPSRIVKTVNEALNLAREYMLITEDKIKIFKQTENHCCAMVSFYALKNELMVILITLLGLLMGLTSMC